MPPNKNDLPLPRHVSLEAQAMLGQPLDMTGFDQIPSTAEEWENALSQRTAPYESMVQDIINAAPLSIEKHEINGVVCRTLTPDTIPEDRQDIVLLNLHGGGYTMFGGDLSAMEGTSLASAGGFKVVSVDYRMPPHHPYPAAIEDGLAVYQQLLATHPAEKIAIFGASAGGGLAASVCLAAQQRGLPMPAAVVLNTPWSDLSKTGDSYYSNDGVDPTLSSYDTGLGAMALLYANGEDLKHPMLSPVYADYSNGFPPAMLITGTRDLLLSCTVRLHRALRDANIEADLHVFESMWHGFGAVPEGKIADIEAVKFLEKHLKI